MPLYEFHCPKCDVIFTELVAWERRDAVRCPRCGSPVQPRVSTFAVGSGDGRGGSGGTAPAMPFT